MSSTSTTPIVFARTATPKPMLYVWQIWQVSRKVFESEIFVSILACSHS